MIKRLGVSIWYFLVATVVGLAVLLSIVRVLLPNMSGYKTDLEELVSKQIGRTVEITGLDAGWSGLSPFLALEQVQINRQDTGGDAIKIQEIHLSLDLWESLLARRWTTHSIELVGLDLTLYRHIDGRWSLNEHATTPDKTPDLEPLLRQNRLGLRDAEITWVDQMQGGMTRVFHKVEAHLINQASKHRFSVKTDLPVSLGKTLELIGEVYGQGVDPAKWSGRIYCKTEALQLREWQHWVPHLPVSVQGTLSSEFWGDWSDRQLAALSGRLSGTDMAFVMTDADRQPYELARLNSRFEWRKTPQGWRINADEINLYRDQHVDWSGIALAAIWNQNDQRFKLSANVVPLEELSLMATQLSFLDARLRSWIDRFEPGGLLQSFELDSRMNDESDTPQISVRAEFTDLSVQASDNLPGISGLAGRLEGNMQQGQLHLDSNGLVVLAPALFKDAKVFVDATGAINWRRYSDRLQVNTPQLRLRTDDDIGITARGQLDWVFADPAPLLDMQVSFDDFDLEKARDYLPVGVMSTKLVDWLNTALLSGKVKSPELIFNGRVDQMPFDQGEGIFQAEFDMQDVVLDYSPHWGKLEKLAGHAQFNNRSMVIHGERARLMQASVSDVVVKIDDLLRPVLTVEGRARDTVSGMLKYVMTTPLKARFGQLVGTVATRGNADLDLDLSIPLKKQLGKVRVKGDVDFKNSRIKSRLDTFDLGSIKGRLHFNGGVLSARDIKARLFNAPVTVALYQAKEAGLEGTTVLDIQGPLQLVEHLQSMGWKFANYLSGNAQWKTRLFFRHEKQAGKTSIAIRLDSDMQGIASSLPAPLNKPADKLLPVTVKWDVTAAGLPVYVQYGDKANAVFARNGLGGIKAGEVVFGGGTPSLPEQAQFNLSGRVSAIKPLEWAGLFKGGSSKSGEFPPLEFNLRADQISLFGYSVQDTFVKSSAASPWDFTLSGDAVEGGLQLIFDKDKSLQTVRAQLERLHLIPPPQAEAQVVRRKKVKVSAIPDLSISIDDLRWGEPEFGSLVLEASAVSGGIDIKQLRLTSSALALTATGQWKDTGLVESTRLEMKILGGSLGQLLAVFSDSDAIEKGAMTGTVTAAWPGSPADFSLKSLEGELALKVGKGRLKDVETGAGRLLGLLSLQSIPRRLFLDFSDLFKEGYSFDELEGSFLFSDGDAFTRDLKIYGPAADIEIVGRTGLVTQDYDELISVIPHLSSALPVAGVIAGGPAVGAVALLAERLLGDQVNKMSKVQYQVTGSWKDPKYTRFKKSRSGNDNSPYDDEE